MALVFQSPGIVLGSLPTVSHLMFIASFLCRCYCHHHYTDEETEAWVGAELAWGHVARGGQRWVWNASRLGGAYTSNHFFLCFKSYSIPRFPAECMHENVQASFPRPSELRVDWQFMLNRILNQYSARLTNTHPTSTLKFVHRALYKVPSNDKVESLCRTTNRKWLRASWFPNVVLDYPNICLRSEQRANDLRAAGSETVVIIVSVVLFRKWDSGVKESTDSPPVAPCHYGHLLITLLKLLTISFTRCGRKQD